jgi:hypothetical protein
LSSGIHLRCPVSSEAIFMVDEPPWSVELYRSLAEFYQISMVDIIHMLTLAVAGEEKAKSELSDRICLAECDAHLLKFKLPLEEAIEIMLRAREGLLWLVEHGPAEQRAKIEALLAEHQAGMAALREKLERRNARIAERRAKDEQNEGAERGS